MLAPVGAIARGAGVTAAVLCVLLEAQVPEVHQHSLRGPALSQVLIRGLILRYEEHASAVPKPRHGHIPAGRGRAEERGL